jgi:hypothetical protein
LNDFLLFAQAEKRKYGQTRHGQCAGIGIRFADELVQEPTTRDTVTRIARDIDIVWGAGPFFLRPLNPSITDGWRFKLQTDGCGSFQSRVHTYLENIHRMR